LALLLGIIPLFRSGKREISDQQFDTLFNRAINTPAQQAPLNPKPAKPAKESTFKNGRQRIGRNDPCHCGSGKKFKHCHGSSTRRAF
jgi:uncharacterized protein YecA (UPF0149 family)